MWEGAGPNASQVGASLLAKNSQPPRSFRKHALSLTFFASKLAPTDGEQQAIGGKPPPTF
ncbi:hypothetical protein CUU62_02170 [Pseudomonas sp. WP001]|uniref:Uncharacterized protein n=1 Tax=Pseudomonas orientalis TaxID=76758 RepID=A0A4Q7D0B8_9PSED|nr:hypothetical protein CUU62_02170 [Pseudomonas sp. WP001]RZI31783.1 hypothetical protein EUX57_10910 [Pseudomonas orientalis]